MNSLKYKVSLSECWLHGTYTAYIVKQPRVWDLIEKFLKLSIYQVKNCSVVHKPWAVWLCSPCGQPQRSEVVRRGCLSVERNNILADNVRFIFT